MATKSVVQEVKEIVLAIELIELGARLQLLEAETSLSRIGRADRPSKR